MTIVANHYRAPVDDFIRREKRGNAPGVVNPLVAAIKKTYSAAETAT